MRRMPSVFGGALFGSALSAVGLRLALQLQTEFLEESDRRCEVVDNNTDVVHPIECHAVSVPLTTPVQTAAADGRVR